MQQLLVKVNIVRNPYVILAALAFVSNYLINFIVTNNSDLMGLFLQTQVSGHAVFNAKVRIIGLQKVIGHTKVIYSYTVCFDALV